MKINKQDLYKVLVKALMAKLGIADQSVIDYSTTSLAFEPILNPYMKILKDKGILDSEGLIDVEKLEREVLKVMNIIPTIKLPIGQLTIVITEEDVKNIFTEMKEVSIVDSVIYLPFKK